ncbi:hypothetical protein Vadar_013826 [Vaccinium darrowii]|uniref:Uncharacterized protein n=1 Tax=Vaccinium darrowii TaxID=229202 RepID=A0ACB7Y6J5_9ERIC|nr:hypothetical protein Vadar_013826 [Vaccinium darrowii]
MSAASWWDLGRESRPPHSLTMAIWRADHRDRTKSMPSRSCAALSAESTLSGTIGSPKERESERRNRDGEERKNTTRSDQLGSNYLIEERPASKIDRRKTNKAEIEEIDHIEDDSELYVSSLPNDNPVYSTTIVRPINGLSRIFSDAHVGVASDDGEDSENTKEGDAVIPTSTDGEPSVSHHRHSFNPLSEDFDDLHAEHYRLENGV